MNVYIYTEDENGDGVLLKRESTGENASGWSTDMRIPLNNDDASSLRAELNRLLAWKEQQQSVNDNGKIDTLQEVLNEVENGLPEHKDISQEQIDSWF
jgi:hypothetical protein